MIVPDWMIREMGVGQGLAVPWVDERVQPASLDLSFGGTWYDFDAGREFEQSEYRLRPGCGVLVCTQEVVHLPVDAAGLLVLKSSLTRRGVVMPCGWVDPGFRGNLTVMLSGYASVALRAGETFCQMVMMRTAGRPDAGYDGRYQDSQGVTVAR